MFGHRKYKLTFRKTYHYKDFGSWTEIRDSALLATLLKLQQKYDFKIVRTKFKDSFGDSYIMTNNFLKLERFISSFSFLLNYIDYSIERGTIYVFT